MSSTTKRGTSVGVPRDHPDYQKLYREKNRERINSYHKEYSKDNRDKRRSYEYSWRESNPDKVKSYNKRGGSKWAALNRGAKAFHASKRRSKVKQATPPWANMEKIKNLYIEAQRLTDETGIPHEVDHIYPLQNDAMCGLHVENNLQILTQSENRSKANSCSNWV